MSRRRFTALLAVAAVAAVSFSVVVANDEADENDASVDRADVGIGVRLEDMTPEMFRSVAEFEERRLNDVPLDPEAVASLYTLAVHADGCGVMARGPDRDDLRLVWEFTDEQGHVFGAHGDVRLFRMFRSGTYTVVLTVWDTDEILPVSNEATVTC